MRRLIVLNLLLFSLPLFLSSCRENFALYLSQLTESEQQEFLSLYASGVELETAFQQAVTGSTSANQGADDEYCSRFVDTAPRGLACLHCMQPEAEAQRKLLTDIMRRSCLRNLATNVLVDGSFGEDFSPVYSIIDELTTNRSLELTLYLLNGPSQRRYKTTPIKGIFTKMAPEDFRSLLKAQETRLLAVLQQHFQAVLEVVDYARSKGVYVKIIPMLEDNLDAESFNQLVRILTPMLETRLDVRIGRNPCSGCYPGNDEQRGDEIFGEFHSFFPVTEELTPGDLLTNDGKSYSLNRDARNYLGKLSGLQEQAERVEASFILWTAEFQGLASNNQGVNIAAKDRSYLEPSAKHQTKILKFLRGKTKE